MFLPIHFSMPSVSWRVLRSPPRRQNRQKSLWVPRKRSSKTHPRNQRRKIRSRARRKDPKSASSRGRRHPHHPNRPIRDRMRRRLEIRRLRSLCPTHLPGRFQVLPREFRMVLSRARESRESLAMVELCRHLRRPRLRLLHKLSNSPRLRRHNSNRLTRTTKTNTEKVMVTETSAGATTATALIPERNANFRILITANFPKIGARRWSIA